MAPRPPPVLGLEPAQLCRVRVGGQAPLGVTTSAAELSGDAVATMILGDAEGFTTALSDPPRKAPR